MTPCPSAPHLITLRLERKQFYVAKFNISSQPVAFYHILSHHHLDCEVKTIFEGTFKISSQTLRFYQILF